MATMARVTKDDNSRACALLCGCGDDERQGLRDGCRPMCDKAGYVAQGKADERRRVKAFLKVSRREAA